GRHPRGQGGDGGEGRKSAWRAPHRRAWHAGDLRPSEGHGGRAGGADGDAERGTLDLGQLSIALALCGGTRKEAGTLEPYGEWFDGKEAFEIRLGRRRA